MRCVTRCKAIMSELKDICGAHTSFQNKIHALLVGIPFYIWTCQSYNIDQAEQPQFMGPGDGKSADPGLLSPALRPHSA